MIGSLPSGRWPAVTVAACSLVLAHLVASTGARADGDADLRARLDGIRAEHDLPAMWAGRFHLDGRRVFAVSGVRKHGDVDPASPGDPIHIGSCTKAMTAVMVARRCSRGTLRFDSTLAEIFPSVGRGDGGTIATSEWATVTVDDLLRHRSGAPPNPDWWALHRAHPDDAVAARRALLEWLLTQPRPEEPGFVYSNIGYALLGHIVETIDDAAWEAIIADDVFQPLGLTTAGFGPVPPENQPGAWGHVLRDGVTEPVRIDNPPPLGPAGRVHLTMEEWSRFVLSFAGDDGASDGPRLGVAPADWARLLAPRESEHYAGGWGLHDRAWGGGRVLSHSGSNTTWYCVAWVAPARDFCLLGATNSGAPAAARACDEAVAACLDPRLLPFADTAERR